MAFAMETDADRDSIFATAELSQDGTYTPPTGAAVTVQVHVDEDYIEIRDERTGEVVDVADVIWFRRDQVSAPAREGTLTIGSTVWKLNQLHKRDVNVVAFEARKAVGGV